MLHDFISSNRQELIRRCRTNANARLNPTDAPAALEHGVPLFLQQLVETLRLEQTTPARHGADSDPTQTATDIGRAAALHGTELLHLGYSVEQVVHDYGDVCQAVTALAVEQDTAFSTDEFRTLNRCLDNAIADAVASFGSAGQISINRQAETLQQRLDIFSAEHRRLIDIAIHSFTAIKTGNIGFNGATGTLLFHALEELRSLAERTLPEIRLASSDVKGVPN
jgi:hypothetical protein